MRVFCLTFGDADCASSLYRVLQYQKPLKEFGIDLRICPVKRFDWDADLRRYDVVVLQKKLISLGKLRRLRRGARRLVYDVDDAIWHPQKGSRHWITSLRVNIRLRAIAKAADLCLAANSILAGHLRQWNEQAVVLPMALDQRLWLERSFFPQADGKIRVGWAGKGVNLTYLEAIEPALASVRSRYPTVEFVVYSGDRPQFKELRFDYVPYKPGTEPEVVRSFDIGLLPLVKGPFAEGKSPIKGLQYMATGIPAVVSPVGASKDLFIEGKTAFFADTMTEWQQSLTTLIEDEARRRAMGKMARKSFEEDYAIGRASAVYAQWLQSLR